MALNLSQADIQQLSAEGYSMQEIGEAVREVEQEELQTSYNQTMRQQDPRMFAQQSAFSPVSQDNLIKWQLELDNILERAEHILRGDALVHEGGHLIWKKQEHSDNQIMNEYGVQEVLRILSMYLNRNTILSDYEPEEIEWKVLDFGRELNDLFFMKYEEMGLSVKIEEAFRKLMRIDNNDKSIVIITEFDGTLKVGMFNENKEYEYFEPNEDQMVKILTFQKHLSLEKRKNYPMLMREIIDIVHSGYKRALHGGERRSLREARSVTQTEPLGGMGMTNINMSQKQQQQRGMLNPMRYILGKYKG